jgi:hypothetical protein
VFKSVLLVDLNVGVPADVIGIAARNAEGGQVAPGGVLDATIAELTWVEALNLLNTDELAKFNFNLDNTASDLLTLSEKWEGVALAPALDPDHPDDYFLFIANDNDFLSPAGAMRQADGSFATYDAGIQNDTIFLAYRITIAAVPEPGVAALLACQLGLIGWLIVARRRPRFGA